MQKFAEQLYATLSQQLGVQNNERCCEQRRTERSFGIARHFWGLLERKVKSYVFSSLEEEVYFFKKIKPLFTLEMEYYHHVYFSLLFLPDMYTFDRVLFWQREVLRMEKFKKENPEFIAYCQSGCSRKDHVFYTRLGQKSDFVSVSLIYEQDGTSTSLYDPLLASFMALEKYCDLARQRLDICLAQG